MGNVADITMKVTTTVAYGEGGVVLTKPTGLAVGDLMIACLGLQGTNTLASKSGWTVMVGGSSAVWSISNLEPSVLWKVADSADVAAADFSFDVDDGTGALGGALISISGFNTTDPTTDGVAGNDSNNSTSRSHTISFTPEQANSIIICLMGCQPNTAMNVTSVSSTGSPTWTELLDMAVGGGVFWVGYAQYPSVTEITNFSAVINQVTDRSAVYLFGVRSRVSATSDADFLAVTPDFFDQAASAGVSATADFLAVTPDFFDQNASTRLYANAANVAKPTTAAVNNVPKP
jgi:hypothetical protein